jgi:type IV secretory pathway VirB2 component (pilin)
MAQPDFFGIVATVLAVVLLVDISVLWISGKQAPELLGQLVFAVFGLYFGRAPLAPRPAQEKAKEGDPKAGE